MMANYKLSLASAWLLATLGTPAYSAASDYQFEPVVTTIKNGAGSEIAVKLIDKRSGKPVGGAVVFKTRLDMSPDSMGEMQAKHEPLPSTEPGVYRFKADFTMAGSWALTLQAKVPGEADTVQGSVVFKAKD